MIRARFPSMESPMHQPSRHSGPRIYLNNSFERQVNNATV